MSESNAGPNDGPNAELYAGFEQGPIRPPSEARSFLLRVTRNCPWNRCTFCPVYKQEKFSIRPVAHIKQDIDAVHEHVRTLQRLLKPNEIQNKKIKNQVAIHDAVRNLPPAELPAFQAALHWLTTGGLKSVFLQDANSLAIKPHHLLEVLRYLQEKFPQIERITSYARSQSIVRLKRDDLVALMEAGLTRLHVGMESGSDVILARVQKGATQELHIRAGCLVKDAGIELSEYYMPGLGGRELARENAIQSATVLNTIDPDYIRLRSLAIPAGIPLYQEFRDGQFVKCNEVEVQEEILLFLENLDGIHSLVRSDHILNLLPEVQGRLPDDREKMTSVLRGFLTLQPKDQRLFQVGRRMGLFGRLRDLDDKNRRTVAEHNCHQLGINADNCDQILDDLMRRFV